MALYYDQKNLKQEKKKTIFFANRTKVILNKIKINNKIDFIHE